MQELTVENAHEATDLELVDFYIVRCQRFVNPRLLRLVDSRGLYNVINFLPTNIEEAKSVARGRMARMGKYFGDDEIDTIAQEIQRVEFLRKQFNEISVTDVYKTLPILREMLQRSEYVQGYFKEVKIP
jgi:hypothetical protein